jgi:hypothetical protein
MVGGARLGAGRPKLPVHQKRSGKILLAFTVGELAALRKAAGSERVATFAHDLVVRALRRMGRA